MSDVKITINKDGPLRVEGSPPLMDHEGNTVETPGEGRPFHLCRCGASENKPFCDGSHNKIDFVGD